MGQKSAVEALIKPALFNKKYNVDYGIYIVGERGSGKSTLAFWLAEKIEQRLKHKYKIAKFLITSREDLLKTVKTLKLMIETEQLDKYYIITIFDEVTKIAQKRKFATKLNKALWELVTVQRPLNSTYFFVTPEVDDIDVELRSPDVIHALIWVYRRGRAYAYVRYGITDPALIKGSIQYIVKYYDEFKFRASFFEMPFYLIEMFPTDIHFEFGLPSKDFVVDNSDEIMQELSTLPKTFFESMQKMDKNYEYYTRYYRLSVIYDSLNEIEEILDEKEENGNGESPFTLIKERMYQDLLEGQLRPLNDYIIEYLELAGKNASYEDRFKIIELYNKLQKRKIR